MNGVSTIEVDREGTCTYGRDSERIVWLKDKQEERAETLYVC